MSFSYFYPCPQNKHNSIHYQSPPLSLSLQITTALHAIQTDCGVGVAVVGNTCCDITVMVGDPASKIDNNMSWGMHVWDRRILRKLFRFSIKKYSLIFPTNVLKLLLERNSITSLEKDRCISTRLTELGEISVNHCEIETIKLRAFSGLLNLALLSMCGNKLREITPHTFEKMNRLTHLVLVGKCIEHLEVDIL